MSRLAKSLFAGALLGLVGVLLCFLRWTHEIEEDAGLGLLFRLRGALPAPPEVAVVSIDKDSAERLGVSGNPSRWPRTLHARLVDQLSREGARATVFDMYFVEARAPRADDEAFATAMRRAGNVVLGEAVRARDLQDPAESESRAVHRLARIVKPIDSFAQAALATAPFVLPRLPVKISRYWTFQPELADAATFPTVALQLFTQEVHGDFLRLLQSSKTEPVLKIFAPTARPLFPPEVSQQIKILREPFRADPELGDKLRAILAQSQLGAREPRKARRLRALIELYAGNPERYLNFYGPPRTIATVPFHEVLAAQSSGAAAVPRFTGKVVFVGLSETLLTEREDSFHTVFSEHRGVFISGVEIAATAFANLLDDNHIHSLDAGHHLLLVFAWGLLIGLICWSTGPLKAALGVGVVTTVYFAGANHLFGVYAKWLPIVVPLAVQVPLGFVATVFWNFFEVNSERQKLRKALGFYVPEDVVRQLARDIVDLRKGDQTISGICLFTDVTGYTQVSESLSPRDLSDLMRRYLEAALEPIQRHGGLVVDLTGDSILAIWRSGALTQAVRQQACDAAIELAQAIRQFNSKAGSNQLPTRIGLHAGEIFLGNVGTGDSYRYGARGDTVNTAARLDSLNRQLGTEILVSEDVLGDCDRYLTRAAGRFLLKGKSQALGVYEVLGRVDAAPEVEKIACGLFANGLEAFKDRSWDEAEEMFRQAVAQSAHAGLPQFYLAHCREYRLHPPSEVWDQSLVLEEK